MTHTESLLLAAIATLATVVGTMFALIIRQFDRVQKRADRCDSDRVKLALRVAQLEVQQCLRRDCPDRQRDDSQDDDPEDDDGPESPPGRRKPLILI